MGSGRRGRPKDEYGQQLIEALQEHFPKFTGVQVSVIKNPAYGLQLSTEAQEVLRGKGIPVPNEKPRRKRSKNSQSVSKKRKSFRLTSEQEVRFSELIKKSGCNSVQEFINKLIEKENEL